MPEIDELLNREMERIESESMVNDEIVVNPITRMMDVPISERLFGVVEDANVEKKYFRCPRYVGDNIDLSKLKIYMKYVHAVGNTPEEWEDTIPQFTWCDDVKVDGNDIVWTWKLSANVFTKKGFMAFAMVAKDENTVAFNTYPAIGTVLTTIPYGSEELSTMYPDIVTQLLKRMDSVEAIATPEAMQNYVNTYLEVNPLRLDETLNDDKKAAPANIVGELKEDLTQLDSRLSESKIDKPTTADNNKFPRAKNGNVEWVEQGLPTDAQTETAVQNWLNAHPEATTTVDNRIVKKVHNTVNSMINDYSLKVDEKVQTLGYYAPSDFGWNSYVVSQTPSNELAIQLNNGLYANPVLSNILNVCAYGVKVQLSNIADLSYEPCDNALQKIIEYASGYNTKTAIKSLFFPAGFYYFDNPINLEDVTNINIFGDSKASSGTATFVFYNSDGIVLAGTQYVNISNVSIVCKKENSNGIYYKYINDKRCGMNRFENISISASICINMQCGCGYDYFVNVSTTKGTAPYYPQTIDKFVHTGYSGKNVGVNYIYFDRCSCQGITYGFHFEEVEYAYIYHCDIVDVEYGVYCVGKNVIKHVQLESNVFWDNTVCAISAYSEEKVPSYIITKSNLIKMISNHDGIYTKNAKAYDIAGLAGKYISNVELDDIIEVEEDHIEKLFTIDFVYGLVLRTPFPVTTPTALDGVGFCSITNIVKDMTQKNYPAFRVSVPASGNITVQKNLYTWYMPSNFISVPRYGGTSLADFTVAPTVNGNKLSIKFTNKTATEIALVVKPEVSVGNDIY